MATVQDRARSEAIRLLPGDANGDGMVDIARYEDRTGKLQSYIRLAGPAEPLTIVADTEGDVLLCCEMAMLPLRRVATALLDGRFHNVEVASRLHTRINVNWSPL
jgi:hypothetical protein